MGGQVRERSREVKVGEYKGGRGYKDRGPLGQFSATGKVSVSFSLS